MFNKSPDNLWNALFNVPQGATMTVAVSLYLGQADLVSIFKTFVCAYCAGVMLTLFLRIPAFGTWISRHIHTDKNPVADSLVCGLPRGLSPRPALLHSGVCHLVLPVGQAHRDDRGQGVRREAAGLTRRAEIFKITGEGISWRDPLPCFVFAKVGTKWRRIDWRNTPFPFPATAVPSG